MCQNIMLFCVGNQKCINRLKNFRLFQTTDGCLVYINDLPMYVNTNIVLYVNVKNSIITSKDDINLIQETESYYDSISRWIEINKIIMNNSKTNIISFKAGILQSITNTQLGSFSITLSNTVKILVTI